MPGHGAARVMKKIDVQCAVRDSRPMQAVCRAHDERCLFTIVHSGTDALRAALRNPPDILVVDAVLPELDGIGLLQRLGDALGERMPHVIGGSVQRFADGEFARCGVKRTVNLPWNAQELSDRISGILDQMDHEIDWEKAQGGFECAKAVLEHMGVSKHLQGFTYLAWACALVCENEARLYAIGERLYGPIAAREQTTAQNVERLIRHAIERTADTVGRHGIYVFFGNTIDPMRGKPTNAQMISVVAQKMRYIQAAGG